MTGFIQYRKIIKNAFIWFSVYCLFKQEIWVPENQIDNPVFFRIGLLNPGEKVSKNSGWNRCGFPGKVKSKFQANY